MTALAGVWSFSDEDRSSHCARMLQAQQVYAPDPPATWTGAGVALGRRLFKILPEDRHDRGPAQSGDGRRILVGDVRLDNRDELLAAIGISRPEGRLLSDSAVVLAALDKWDEEAIPRLYGDFAFALWDGPRRRMILARDFLGNRPLHYHAAPGFFAFASMPKGLHALDEIPREPDVDAVTRFLALMPESVDDSFFGGIKRVRPAHFCIVTSDGIRSHRYWKAERRDLGFTKAAEYQGAIREGMDRAVAARLRGADGHVATHLSGGLDSSTVTATAARLLGADGRVAAFTSVPREGYAGPIPRGRFIDEGPLAAAVARLYPQVEHVLLRTGGHSPLAGLDRQFFMYERPLLNLCNHVWVEAICEGVRQRRMRVLLTGQHGNMSFSYSGMEQLPQLLASGRLITLMKLLVELTRHGISWEGAIAQTIGPFLPPSLWKSINRARGRHLSITDYSMVHPEAPARLGQIASEAGLDFSYRPRKDPFETRVWVLERVDSGNFNKGQLGGWGVDVRDPTADRRLIELCLSIPVEQFLLGGMPRALARNAFADRLPPEVLFEWRKGLQAADWHEGFNAARTEVVEEIGRICATEQARPAIHVERLQKLTVDWPTDGWTSDRVMRHYRLATLRGVSSGHFIRKAAGSNV